MMVKIQKPSDSERCVVYRGGRGLYMLWGPTQAPIQWILLRRDKAARA
jgi:hypothetical protein